MMKSTKRKRHYGFTLAEVLITLAIIGVVAALSIPAVISNSQQQEFKTGLRKAVSVLNSAITMNMALEGESPYDNANLFGYLTRHMNIIKTTARIPYYSYTRSNGSTKINYGNSAFYTADGMRYEFNVINRNGLDNGWETNKLHESNIYLCSSLGINPNYTTCLGCGSYGLNTNIDNTSQPPCLFMVDVNGDKKPTPGNINCYSTTCANQNKYVVPYPNIKKVSDIFTIMITDKQAIPFGVTAQRAMYQAQK